MRAVINGSGVDVTSTVHPFQRSNRMLYKAHLYLIGEVENPFSIWLTDWDSPLLWSWWGTFRPTVITRANITSEVGLESKSVDVVWSPKPQTIGNTISTASFRQLAQHGYYKNWRVRIWKCYMPTPGDANTYGAAELFGGRVGDLSVGRDSITFSVESFLNVLDQKVPPNVIEVLNTSAAFTAATPPSGFVRIPQFDTIIGSSVNVIIGDQTFPVPGSILDTNNCRGGFLVFNNGGTLDGFSLPIQQNVRVTVSGTDYNQFVLYGSLPWPPTPGTDTFYVSGPSPINKVDGSYIGFPYIPAPTKGF